MQKILSLIILIGIVIVGVWWFTTQDESSTNGDSSAAPTEDTIDVVMNFYEPWLTALRSTTSDPYQADLVSAPVVSEAVQAYIENGQASDVDPVLCQAETPERVVARELFRTDEAAEVQVLSRGLPEASPNFALVALQAVDGAWQISDISCRSGESGPEREFTFEREGYLLKSVPEPLNPDYWHLVYTENDIPGQTVPLFFDEASQCQAAGEQLITCDESLLEEATRATVRGTMTESGVNVRFLEY